MSAESGLPDTFAALAGVCEDCGRRRGPDALTEGVCGACLLDAEVGR